jgi:hypothetical protein
LLIDIPSDVNVMMTPCLDHYVSSSVHSGRQKTGQILALTTSTMTLSLRYVAMAMDARVQNCECHVAYACGMLCIRAMIDSL